MCMANEFLTKLFQSLQYNYASYRCLNLSEDEVRKKATSVAAQVYERWMRQPGTIQQLAVNTYIPDQKWVSFNGVEL